MKLPEEYRQIGNLAIAKIDVKGLPQRMEAFSSFQKGEHGFISLPETKIFKPISVDKYHNIASPPRGTLRNIDGEYKLLETIAQQLGNNRNVSGRIDLFTELKACQSCSNVIFCLLYPSPSPRDYADSPIPSLVCPNTPLFPSLFYTSPRPLPLLPSLIPSSHLPTPYPTS
ncbi:deaminase domain-containing protein, partial [Neisseria meningitidis]|uniref:deaminase domain-containing protein n=1 Tax=Neisseria meningitidis TaxID=487 RepID=UPI0021A9DE69